MYTHAWLSIYGNHGRRSNRGGTRQCHAEVISTRDLQRAVDFVSGVVPWKALMKWTAPNGLAGITKAFNQ